MRAAIEVADRLGLVVDDPVLIQETNNTIVWLRPNPAIAKVGTHAYSAETLVLEHDVAAALTVLGAPVVSPLLDVKPVRDPETGFVVTLWNRMDHDPNVVIDGKSVGRSLRQIHQGLSASNVPLPSFRVDLKRAQIALSDDARVGALAPGDRMFLRAAFAHLLAELNGFSFPEQGLHGDPAAGNFLMTAAGLRWIDFESASRGPLEWDLAFLSDDVRSTFKDVDFELLELLITLKNTFIATWCWVRARFPEMRRHAERHLDLVRSRWP